MKKLIVISFVSAFCVACGSKPARTTTPSNKTDKKTDGAMGGTGYGGAKPTGAPPTTPSGDPCAM